MFSEPEKCCTCGRASSAPFRRIVDGKIDVGCIDEFHTGHLYGTSREWHDQPSARIWRAKLSKHLTEMLGTPMRGYGLPGKLERNALIAVILTATNKGK